MEATRNDAQGTVTVTMLREEADGLIASISTRPMTPWGVEQDLATALVEAHDEGSDTMKQVRWEPIEAVVVIDKSAREARQGIVTEARARAKQWAQFTFGWPVDDVTTEVESITATTATIRVTRKGATR